MVCGCRQGLLYKYLRKDSEIWAGHGSVKLNSNLGLNDCIWGLEIKDSKAVYIMCPVSHPMIKQWFTISSVSQNHLCTCQNKGKLRTPSPAIQVHEVLCALSIGKPSKNFVVSNKVSDCNITRAFFLPLIFFSRTYSVTHYVRKSPSSWLFYFKLLYEWHTR